MLQKKTFLVVCCTMLSLVVTGQPAWHKQISPVPGDLVSVSFADSVNGWAVSDSGTVIHTANGGLTWEVQHAFKRFFPGKIFFQDRQTGWLAGVDSSANDTALILKTLDGGNNWDTSYVLLLSKIYDIFFINDTMGWAVGFTGDTLGLRLHTVDGGETWSVQAGINVLSIFSSVHFRDTEKGDICGPGPVMLHTISGGRGTSPWALDIFNLKKPMYDLVNLGEEYGCLVGADGKLFFTKDHWINFLEYDYPGEDTLWSVDAIEPLGFWVVGEAGTILFVGYTDFLGLAVEDQSMDVRQDLFEIDALDDRHAWAVGEEGTILFYGFDQSSRLNNPSMDGIEVFPNPAIDQIRIHNLDLGTQQIELYSMQGRLMRSMLVPGGQKNAVMYLHGLNPGTYILKAGAEQRQMVVIQP